MSYKVMIDPRDNMLDFQIYDMEKGIASSWYLEMEVTVLNYENLFHWGLTCYESAFLSLWEDYIKKGIFSLVEFETFQEVVEYLNDLIFLHELKK